MYRVHYEAFWDVDGLWCMEDGQTIHVPHGGCQL